MLLVWGILDVLPFTKTIGGGGPLSPHAQSEPLTVQLVYLQRATGA